MSVSRVISKQKKQVGHTAATLRDAFGSPSKTIANGLAYVADTADWTFTWFRSYQVFSAVLYNSGSLADSHDVPETDFNKHVHHADGSLTLLGWGFAGAMGASFFVGVGRALYRHHRALRLQSYAYLQKRMQEVQAVNGHSPQAFNEDKQVGLLGKISNNYVLDDSLESPYITLKRIKPYSVTVQNQQDNVASKKQLEPAALQKVAGFINRVKNSAIGNALSYAWNWMQGHAFLFWLVWMPFALVLGLGVALAASMPLVVGLTFGIGAVFAIAKGVEMLLSYLKDRKDLRNIKNMIEKPQSFDKNQTPEKNQFQQDIQNIINSLENNSDYQDLNSQKKPKFILAAYRKAQAEEMQEKNLARKKLIQRSFMKYEHAALLKKLGVQPGQKISLPESSEIVEDASVSTGIETPKARLKARLTGSHAEHNMRIALMIISAVVLGFIMPMFIFWLVGSIAGIFVGVGIFAAVTAFCGSSFGASIASIVGTALGGFFGISSWADQYEKKINYINKVEEKLEAQYKNESKNGFVVSKAEKFVQLEAMLNAQIAKIKQNPAAQKILKKAGYDLSKIDVYNDYYFEKQKHSPSAWTWIKKSLNRAYALIGGGQAGVMIARSVFLAGAVGAGVLTLFTFAAPVALVFIGVAAILALTFGAMRLARYQLERKQQHREFFVDTIDERISYLKKKNKELAVILKPLPPNQSSRGSTLRVPTSKSESVFTPRAGTLRSSPSPALFADASQSSKAKTSQGNDSHAKKTL